MSFGLVGLQNVLCGEDEETESEENEHLECKKILENRGLVDWQNMLCEEDGEMEFGESEHLKC